MKLVVDTNILFTFFWKNGTTRNLFFKQTIQLFTPYFAIEELKKNIEEIIEKTKINKQKFDKLLRELTVLVNPIPLNKYEKFLSDAIKISPDPNDIDFFALALEIQSSIWSNDSKLKNQKIIDVLNTKEVVELIA